MHFDDLTPGDLIFVAWDGTAMHGEFDGFERWGGHYCLRLLTDGEPPFDLWHILTREITAVRKQRQREEV